MECLGCTAERHMVDLTVTNYFIDMSALVTIAMIRKLWSDHIVVATCIYQMTVNGVYWAVVCFGRPFEPTKQSSWVWNKHCYVNMPHRHKIWFTIKSRLNTCTEQQQYTRSCLLHTGLVKSWGPGPTYNNILIRNNESEIFWLKPQSTQLATWNTSN